MMMLRSVPSKTCRGTGARIKSLSEKFSGPNGDSGARKMELGQGNERRKKAYRVIRLFLALRAAA
jgi:hypothetical protein